MTAAPTTKRERRERIAALSREPVPEVAVADPQVVRLTKYCGVGGDVKHDWLMSDGSTLAMTNAESIHYSFALDRQRYRVLPGSPA